MNDKKFTRFIVIFVIAFLIFWWLYKRWLLAHQSTPSQSPGVGLYNDPELLTYAANPDKFGPQTVNGQVNISVSGYNGLNQNYMPLFGFVGMAQGELYQ